jgi:gamma-glutamylaminecyclotransferase
VKHLVFVYGTLKRHGGAWEYFLINQKFVGEATSVNKFIVLGGGFPVALYTKEEAPIRGEIYEVDDETVERLDGYEGEGHLFKRQLQRFLCTNGETLAAQMYFGIPEVWSHRADDRGLAPIKDGYFQWSPHGQT